MNDLQHISEAQHGPVFVTLNPPFEPDAAKINGRWKYDHPVLDTKVCYFHSTQLIIDLQNLTFFIQGCKSPE